MRLLTKAAIVLFAIYAAFLVAVGLWMEHSVQSVSRSLLENTARLLGNDIAAVLSKAAIDDLRLADPEARRRLEEAIEDITARSEVVSSLSVADSMGKIVASDEDEVGRQVADPNLIFTGPGRLVRGESDLIYQDDTYFLLVALLDHKEIVGYLRMALHSEPLSVVYKRARRDFSVIAMCGLLAILGMLTWLRAALLKRRASLLESFNTASTLRFDEDEVTADEFVAVQESARRMRTQLATAAQQAAQLQTQLEALQVIGKLAVLYLNPDRSLRGATQRARDLFGDPETDELEKRWNEIQALIEDGWDSGVVTAHGRLLTIALIDTKPPRTLQLQLLPLGEGGGNGFVAMVADRVLRDSQATDLAAALEFYTLQASGRAAAATATQVTADIDTALQGLRESFEGEPELQRDRHEQQTEYVDSIEDGMTTLAGAVQSLAVQIHPRSPTRGGFDVQEMLGELLSLLRPSALARNIELELRVAPGSLVLAAAYWGMRDAMLSLVLHLLDWMPEGTNVLVDVRRDAADLAICLRSSTASTLSADAWQLYEPYLLDDQGSARLGLGVARYSVEALGGKLHISADAAGGTNYELTLPLATKAAGVSA